MSDRSARRTSFAPGPAKAEGPQHRPRCAARPGAIALCMTLAASLAACDGDRTTPPGPASQAALMPAPGAGGASTSSALPPASTLPPAPAAPAANAFEPRAASPQAAASTGLAPPVIHTVD